MSAVLGAVSAGHSVPPQIVLPGSISDTSDASPGSGRDSLGFGAPIGDLCALLPQGGPPLEVDPQTPIATVCRLLHERAATACLVRPAQGGGEFRLFRPADLCSPLLDALRADPSATRVIQVLSASAVRDVAPKEAIRRVPAATPLTSLLPRLLGETGEALLVESQSGKALRIFGCAELLELLLRHGRGSCTALQEPARCVALSAASASGASGVAKTAVASVPALRCFEDLKTLGLRGLPVLDAGGPEQSLVERALGTIYPEDVLQFFLGPPDEGAMLVSCSAREFVIHRAKELATPRGRSSCHSGDARYPFIHADVEQSIEALASKLLTSRSSSIALCSHSMREVRTMVCASDIVRSLQGHIPQVKFAVEPAGSAPPSPRMWPSPMATSANAVSMFALPLAATTEELPDHAQHVQWLDEVQPGAPLAQRFEYAAAAEAAPAEARSPVLMLADAPPEAFAPGSDLVRLPPLPPAAAAAGPGPGMVVPLMVGDRPGSAEEQLTGRVLSAFALGDMGRTLDGSPTSAGSPLEVLAALGGEALAELGEGGEWQQVADGGHASSAGHGHTPGGQGGGASSYVSHATEQLQLVLYQQRDLVLYDRRSNRAYARRLTEEQANALAQNRHSYCPLCRQHLDPSWAFVVEGYFDILNGIAGAQPSTSSSSSSATAAGFSNNEEAAAAAGLHNIPSGLLNCGYYSRFFVEEKKLGAGSFGAVYLCRHVMDEIELGVFAVKKLALGDDTKRLRQVVREVKALERLRHMNIIDYKHSWLEISRHSAFCPYVPFLFILMEFCNAGSLEDLIWPSGFERGASDNAAKATMMSEELIWTLFLDICRGLRHLHSRSILHRDLKPSNVLLHVDEITGEKTSGDSRKAPAPRALLSDLGTCEILGERGQSGHIHGEYAIEFMAPERLRGEESDEPADMWSAGLTLYAMCYGDLPYHSEDPMACRERVMAHSVLSEMPDFREQTLRGLISVLTARSPVARPTAEEAEQVCFQNVCRHQSAPKANKYASPRSQPSLPSPSAPPPLELMDASTPRFAGAAGGLRPSAMKEPPSKILRITSVTSLASGDGGGHGIFDDEGSAEADQDEAFDDD